jgi:hypothetical protein
MANERDRDNVNSVLERINRQMKEAGRLMEEANEYGIAKTKLNTATHRVWSLTRVLDNYHNRGLESTGGPVIQFQSDNMQLEMS